MAKKVFYDAEAREKILGGAKALYDAVKVAFSFSGSSILLWFTVLMSSKQEAARPPPSILLGVIVHPPLQF